MGAVVTNRAFRQAPRIEATEFSKIRSSKVIAARLMLSHRMRVLDGKPEYALRAARTYGKKTSSVLPTRQWIDGGEGVKLPVLERRIQ